MKITNNSTLKCISIILVFSMMLFIIPVYGDIIRTVNTVEDNDNRGEPSASEEPVISEEPAITDEPVTTDEPIISEDPEPTVEPKLPEIILFADNVEVEVGQEIEVSIQISPPKDVVAFQFYLNYEKDIIRPASDNCVVFDSSLIASGNRPDANINEFGVIRFTKVGTTKAVNTSMICTVTFRAIATGNSKLSFSNVAFSRGKDGIIPCEVEAGSVLVKQVQATPTPSPTIAASSTPRPTATARPTPTPTKKPTNSNGTGTGTSTTKTSTPRPTTTPNVTPIPGNTATPMPSVSPGTGSLFNDLEGHEWAKEAVTHLKQAGIINGVSETEFSPETNVTRAEFAKMVVLLYGFHDSSNAKSFTDVSGNDWFKQYVDIASSMGIVNGYDDGSFGANENITREDLCVMIVRGAKLYELDLPAAQPEFIDIDTFQDYSKESVGSLASLGIVNGKGDGLFAPADNATRAEAAKIIYGIYQLIHK